MLFYLVFKLLTINHKIYYITCTLIYDKNLVGYISTRLYEFKNIYKKLLSKVTILLSFKTNYIIVTTMVTLTLELYL